VVDLTLADSPYEHSDFPDEHPELYELDDPDGWPYKGTGPSAAQRALPPSAVTPTMTCVPNDPAQRARNRVREAAYWADPRRVHLMDTLHETTGQRHSRPTHPPTGRLRPRN
jgi:hypothetical protein